MTDIYKKLYGYENDIQLKDDDIKKLEGGMELRKMNQKKTEFNDRFYRLDLNNNQLVASTKEFRKKEKLYPLISINEVKSGTASDNLKAFQLKKSMEDKKQSEIVENTSFVILYENYKKTLDLMAPSELERDRWVRVLSYFIILAKKRKGVLPETDKIMRNYFELADTGSDKKVNESEVSSFLKNINLNLKKDLVKKLMKNADTNNDGQLDEEEFQTFIQQLNQRKEIISLFKLITVDASNQATANFIPEHMPVKRFRLFLERYQKERKTEEECIQILQKYEPTDWKSENKFTLYGFTSYLNDSAQFISDFNEEDEIYQDINRPLCHFFINSSHNTYLFADQLVGESGPQAYVNAIMNGARLVEADCYDGQDGVPVIFHKHTLISKIKFEDVLIAIKPYAFKLTSLPLIITIELHCSPTGQRNMVDIIKKHLKEYLFLDEVNPNSPPTLNELRNKILLRFSIPKANNQSKDLARIIREASKDSTSSFPSDDIEEDDDEEDISTIEEIKEMSDLQTAIKGAPFKGAIYALHNYERTKTSSISEAKFGKMLSSERAEDIIRYCANYLNKVYPAFYRQLSSNLDPIQCWIYGFQIAALNFQTNDLAMQLNRALFADNGGCGYVLKPEILLNPSLNFNPLNLNTMKNKKVLEIKIISGQKLPDPAEGGIIRDISDPYVTVSVHGVPADQAEAKTQIIKDNGFNPIWNQDFKFVINCPELAFIRFAVKDDDLGKDQLIGHYELRFENMRPGYRHIPLINKKSKGTLFVGVRIYKFESIKEWMTN